MKLFNTLLKAASLGILGATGLTFSLHKPAGAQSSSMPVCNFASQNVAAWAGAATPCRATPDGYEITVYKMGLCPTSPITGTTFDISGCETTYSNPGGQKAQLVNSDGTPATVDLATVGDLPKPSNGSYPYAFILMGNTFGITETATFADATWRSTSTTAQHTDGSGAYNGHTYSVGSNAATTAQQGDTLLENFGSNTPACSVTGEPVAGGSIDAILLGADQATGTTVSGSHCPSSVYIGGVMNLNSAIEITDATTGLLAQFVTTNNGTTIIPAAGPAVNFDGGPFGVIFTVVE